MRCNIKTGFLTTIALSALVASAGFTSGQDKQAALEPQQWLYTFQAPRRGWQGEDFETKNWRRGFGGFGTKITPNSRVSTEWRSNDIWLRQSFELAAVPSKPALYIYHDEDAEVFINGQQVAKLTGYVTEYQVVPLDKDAAALLKAGENLLAVHCHQTGGGQFIDVFVIDADNVPKLPPPVMTTEPFKTELTTQWGEKVTPENAWQEYPRPQFVRENWQNLNGNWDYAITPNTASAAPREWKGQILVPFAVESKLSGVQRLLRPDETLWYHRTFEASPNAGERTLLNFEAVDYRSQIWVNGKQVGEHIGGNTPFSMDVTDALKSGENTLIVRVDDETEAWQLRGKQVLDPRGIWYTQVSGIWQTVWLENVPKSRIADLKISTNAEDGTISVTPQVSNPESGQVVQVLVMEGESQLSEATAKNGVVELSVANAKLWSPDSPHLYGLEVRLLNRNGDIVDTVKSYTGIRSVGKVRDENGHWRFTLNGEILFHWGPLDQGWWPDGLLTPPSDDALAFDVKFLKAAGFNMIRKHIKVEPRRFYYHCDRLGMMLWQDQVSGGQNPPWTRMKADPEDAQWPDEAHEQFMIEFEQMVDQLENHPSIVVWVPFNEAWGQHRTVEVGKWIIKRDPSRLVNIASGGNFWPVGDIADHHSYPHPDFPFEPGRYDDYIIVVGEFGGHGYPVRGHLFDPERQNWGYGGLPKDEAEYKERYLESMRIIQELKAKGVAGGIYTQTTDVEGEINGLMTYDRKVIKIPAADLKKIHAPLVSEE